MLEPIWLPAASYRKKGSFPVALIKQPFPFEPRVLSLSLSMAARRAELQLPLSSDINLWEAGLSEDMAEVWSSHNDSFNLMCKKKKRELCHNTPVSPDTSFIQKCAKVYNIKTIPFPEVVMQVPCLGSAPAGSWRLGNIE